MRYLSVCSGIEATTVAWHPLGWEAAAFSEIEAFPRAVLTHHYPNVPLHGDFTTIQGDEYGSVDLLVGGTPCQSFSVAGLRKGMADERGNLALEFLRLADRLGPRWIVWENVPGVLSSNGGRDFGAFLGGLAELGYGWSYRILDAQYAGVPQRRRRVFVVGYLGDWRRAAAVLFERHSLSGHPAPRRKAGEEIAGVLTSRASGGGGGPGAGTDEAAAGYLQAVAHPLTAREGKGPNSDCDSGNLIAHTLRADGFDASEDGTGRGTPLVPIAIQERAVCENPNAGPDGAGFRADGMAYTLEARSQQQAVAFSCKDHGADAGEVAPTLRSMGHDGSHANGGGQVAVALNLRGREGGGTIEVSGEVATALRASQGGGDKLHTFSPGMAVRRITPMEAERLQGFPDGYTNVPYRGKPAADGPRYKALGNSMAVPVMAWLGMRIAAVEAMRTESRKSA